MDQQQQATKPRTILFALDESPHSISALTWTFRFVLKQGDHLCLVVGIENEKDRPSVSSQQDIHYKTLERVKTLLRAEWESCHITVDMGIRVLVANGSNKNAGKLICELVNEMEPHLLVLGSAGKSNLQGFLVGSVSQYCLANANCPVVVARMEQSFANKNQESPNRNQNTGNFNVTHH